MKKKRVFFATFTVGCLLLTCGIGAAFEGESVIIPGEGIDGVRIGEKPRGEITCNTKNGIEIGCNQRGLITVIHVRSPRYGVDKSLLHVGSTVGELFRYYKRGEQRIKGETVILRYPSQGIEFEINKFTEKITRITVYEPVLPSFKDEIYKQYRDQYREQFKK